MWYRRLMTCLLVTTDLLKNKMLYFGFDHSKGHFDLASALLGTDRLGCSLTFVFSCVLFLGSPAGQSHPE